MYDFIIVGTRVAGAACALLLGRKGFKVLLLDQACFPSDTVSTHLLQPRAMAYLYHWGLADTLKKITPAWNTFCYTRESVSFKAAPSPLDLAQALQEAHGWNKSSEGAEIPVEWMSVRRTVLDETLVQAAKEAGVELRQNFRVESILFDKGQASGVSGVSETGQKEEVQGKFVIVAGGRHNTLLRDCGAKVIKEHLKSEFCFYNYFEMDSSDLDVPFHLRGQYGLAYSPTNGNLHIVSVFGPSENGREFYANLEHNFKEIVTYCYPKAAERLGDFKTAENYKGMINIPNKLMEASGPGWVAVGDAACSLSQSTAIGITNAFIDAEFACQALTKAFSGKISLEAAIKEYESKHFNGLEEYFNFVCDVSECSYPTPEQIALLYALKSNPKQAGRLISVIGRIIPVSSFFNPKNLQEIISSLDEKTINSIPFIKNYQTIIADYQQRKPWDKPVIAT